MGTGMFPITYSEELPGVQSAVIADVSKLVRPGAELLAQEVEQAGKKLVIVGEAIQEAKSKLELTNLQRQDSEFRNAAINALDSPDLDIFDDEKVAELKAKVDADRTTQVSKYDAANLAYQSYLNQTSAGWNDAFAERVNEIRSDNLRDNYELNAESLLEGGDIAGYMQLITDMRNTGVISQAEFDYQKKNAHTNSIFAQSAKNLEQGNLGMSELLLNSLDVKKLDTTQLKYRNKLLKATQQTSKEQTDTAISEMVLLKDKHRNATILEKQAIGIKMKEMAVAGGLVGDDRNRWFGIIDEWVGGGTDATEEYDPKMYAAVNAQVMLEPDALTDRQIYSLVGLGTEGGITTKQAETLTKLRKTNSEDVSSVNTEISRRYQTILKGMHNAELFGKGVEGAKKWAETANDFTIWANENKDATPAQAEEFFEQLTAEQTKRSWVELAKKYGPYVAFGPQTIILKTNVELYKWQKARREKRKEFLTGVMDELKTTAPPREVGKTYTDENGVVWFLKEVNSTNPNDDVWEEVK